MGNFDKILKELEGLSDEALINITASTPWQQASIAPVKDEDGFQVLGTGSAETLGMSFHALQKLCWESFNQHPFIYTSTNDTAGRLVGRGFGQYSSEPKIQDVIDKTWEDPRNDLVVNFKKYIVRQEVQGELFLVMTLHDNGFVEIDFMSPTKIKGFDDGTGIKTPKGKPSMPLLYAIEQDDGSEKYIPSINIAYYPSLENQITSEESEKIVGKVDGKFTKYIVQYSSSAVTKRNVGGVRTTLQWLNHYDDLKKWEIDHKKSAGSYLWVFTMQDKATLRQWLAMSPEEREATGILKPKSPGGSLILPPGFELSCENPNLPSISDQDTDILDMISSGLNVQRETMTGSSSGTTYGGAKMGSGPTVDRTADKIEDLERFMRFHFWRAVFFLASSKKKMPLTYKAEVAYKFEKGKPKYKKVSVEAHKGMEIDFPVSAVADMEGVARATLGVKHSAISDQLGISNSEVAKKLGFNSYRRQRLQHATEENLYPKLATSAELESSASKTGEAGLEAPVKEDQKDAT